MAGIDVAYLAQEERGARIESRQGLIVHALVFTAFSIVLIAINVSVRDVPWSALAIAALALGLYLHWLYGVHLSTEKLHYLVADGRARAPGGDPSDNGAQASAHPPVQLGYRQATTEAGPPGDDPPGDGPLNAVVVAQPGLVAGGPQGATSHVPLQVSHGVTEGIKLAVRWAQLDMRQAVIAHSVVAAAFSVAFVAMNAWIGGFPWAVFPIAFMAVGLFLHWLYGTRLGVAGLLGYVQRVEARPPIDHGTDRERSASTGHEVAMHHRRPGIHAEKAR